MLTFGISVACVSPQASAQDTQIKFFGQPEFVGGNTSKQGGFGAGKQAPSAANPFGLGFDDSKVDTNSTNFNTGKFVMFVTSQLSERVSVLSENSASYNNGQFQFEIERLLLRYYVKDYFSVRVGKMFNPIGYWNNQYNLGLILQPTIQRPLVIRNSSDGGVLQIKDVGAQIEGDNITKLRFSYRFFASNGLSFNGNNDKSNTSTAFTASAGIEPLDGLKFILSARTAELYKGKPNLTGVTPTNGRQIMTNVALAYMNPEKKPEFIAELYQVKNQLDDIGDRFSYGYFAYAGYKVTPKAVPYISYSYAQAGTTSSADPYFVREGILVNQSDFLVGFRYKISSNLVWKIEFSNSKLDYTYKNNQFQILGPTPPFYPNGYMLTDGDKKSYTITNSIRMQFAFAF